MKYHEALQYAQYPDCGDNLIDIRPRTNIFSDLSIESIPLKCLNANIE